MTTTRSHADGALRRSTAQSTDHIIASTAQRRIWLLDRLRQCQSTELNIPFTVSLRGPLDVIALRRSVGAIVRRHDVLRTYFAEHDGEPVQVVVPFWEVPIKIIDICGVGCAFQDKRVAALLRRAYVEPFDLSQGPLLRCIVFVMGQDHHLFSTHAHHVVWDAWSQGIWNREISILYDAYRVGGSDPLPPLRLQYGDYAEWERSAAQTAATETHLAYWREQLRGAAERHGLLTDRSRRAARRLRGARQCTSIPAEVIAGARVLGGRRGMTIYMTLLAAFSVLLERYSQDLDVLIGTPVANRPHEELAWLIGCFVNFVVCRMQIRPDATLDRVMSDARTTVLNALQHQGVSFDRVVEALAPLRRPDTPPLFQVVLTLHSAPQIAATLAGLKVETLQRTEAPVGYDLEVHAIEREGGLDIGWRYDVDLFDAWRIAQLARHFESVLRAMVENPQQSVSHVPLLTDAERRQALDRWHSVGEGVDDLSIRQSASARTLPELFERQVGATPERIAAIHRDNAITYAELNARANRLARVLIERGVGPEGIVAVAIDRSIEMAIAVLGVLKAGAAYLPLPLDYPPVRLVRMIEQSGSVVVLTVGSGRALPVTATRLGVDDVVDDRSVSSEDVTDDERLNVLDPDHPAYVIYTSGSSGRPKGVVGLHRGIVNRLRWSSALPPARDGVVLARTSLSFIDGSTELLGALMSGRTVVLVDQAVEKQLHHLSDLVRRHLVTQLTTVPSLLQVLLEEWDPKRTAMCRSWLASGEMLPAVLVQRFASAYPDAELLNLYGMTEATGDSMWGACHLTQHNLTDVVWNTHIMVLDGRMEPVPFGVRGDICIGGDGLARGYLNDPGLTAARFIPNPHGPSGSRMYVSGDVACCFPERRLQVLGRSDAQAKIAGVRTNLAEVEAALLSLGDVTSAAVVVREQQKGLALVAYVVPSRGASLDEVSVQHRLRQALPASMVPALIIALADLPRTASGKVDRSGLVRRPLPKREAASEASTIEEKALCQIFSELFPEERVDRSSNFFDLGGHSLQAMQVMSRVRQRLDIEMDGSAVFDAPRIADLAAYLVRVKASLA